MDMAGEEKKKTVRIKNCLWPPATLSVNIKKTGNLRTNVTLKRVCATIVAVDEQ